MPVPATPAPVVRLFNPDPRPAEPDVPAFAPDRARRDAALDAARVRTVRQLGVRDLVDHLAEGCERALLFAGLAGVTFALRRSELREEVGGLLEEIGRAIAFAEIAGVAEAIIALGFARKALRDYLALVAELRDGQAEAIEALSAARASLRGWLDGAATARGGA